MPDYGMPPVERTIIPPVGGWEENTYYVVEVSHMATRPIHRAIFFSGLLDEGCNEPGTYNAAWSGTYEPGYQTPIMGLHYLKVISTICVEASA